MCYVISRSYTAFETPAILNNTVETIFLRFVGPTRADPMDRQTKHLLANWTIPVGGNEMNFAIIALIGRALYCWRSRLTDSLSCGSRGG